MRCSGGASQRQTCCTCRVLPVTVTGSCPFQQETTKPLALYNHGTKSVGVVSINKNISRNIFVVRNLRKMAEICLGSSTEVCEPSTRAARRRRMEIQRFKFVAGAESMASSDELRRKNRNREDVADKNSDGDGESSSNPEGSDQGPSSVESEEAEQWPSYGMTSVCGRRRDMEDAVSIRPNFLKASSKHHFFGVFDGHGCSHVADSCRDRMHEIVAAEMESTSSRPSWKEAMEKGFDRMDAEVVASPGGSKENPNCRCELQTPKCDHVGSTAVVAVVSSDRIVVANCGDSRAVLGRKRAVLPLSVDHKPDRPDELERINAAGGRVIYWDGARVLGVLAMSRAIGDGYLKPFVTSLPEVTITDRTDDDECLILASDGLWDVVSNETACDVVRMCLRGNAPAREGEGDGSRDSDKACSDAAMLLTKLALARQSADNVSVVVVDLRRNL